MQLRRGGATYRKRRNLEIKNQNRPSRKNRDFGVYENTKQRTYDRPACPFFNIIYLFLTYQVPITPYTKPPPIFSRNFHFPDPQINIPTKKKEKKKTGIGPFFQEQ